MDRQIGFFVSRRCSLNRNVDKMGTLGDPPQPSLNREGVRSEAADYAEEVQGRSVDKLSTVWGGSVDKMTTV